MADEQRRPWWQDRRAPPEGQEPQRQPPRPRMKPRMPPEGQNTGGQEWWQDRRVPKQWQDQTEQPPPPQRPKRQPPSGQGSADAYGSATPDESARMLRGAFQAGINGDDGAMQSFPNTPFGQRLRQEFMRGRNQRQKPGRGLGFSQADRG